MAARFCENSMRILSFSHFSHAADNVPQRMKMTWPDFEAYIQVPRKPLPVAPGDDPKKGMAAFCPAVFKTGTTRAVENVLELNLFCVDFDNSESVPTGEFHLDKTGKSTGRPKTKKACIADPVSIEDVAVVLRRSGVDHLLHPSWSDKATWPHFHLIIPLAQAIRPELWDRATAWTFKHVGLEPFLRGVDLPVLKDVARIYFLPGGPNV